MNKRMAGFFVAIIATAIILELYSYVHVSGTQIAGASEISTGTVTVEKVDAADPSKNQTWTLDSQQKADLQKLVLATTFKRTGKTQLNDLGGQQYVIKADFGAARDPLVLTSYGSEYANAANQFGGKFLQILNFNWQDKMESILSKSAG